SPGDDKPFGAVPRREGTAMPSVSAQDQPEVHRYTTSNTRETRGLFHRQKRRLLLIRGVLLCLFISALYLVLSERTPGPPPQLKPSSAGNTEGNQPTAPLTNSLGMQFTLIPAGEFQMGSTSGDDDERPVHTVRISGVETTVAMRRMR